MKDDQRQFLTLHARLPARLTMEQTAWIINCALHDIPVLVAGRLLKPLGDPPPNGVKYFATTEILELANDKAWLNRATHCIQQYWQGKNLHRKQYAEGLRDMDEITRPPMRVAGRKVVAA